jgi:hypothetical protein
LAAALPLSGAMVYELHCRFPSPDRLWLKVVQKKFC